MSQTITPENLKECVAIAQRTTDPPGRAVDRRKVKSALSAHLFRQVGDFEFDVAMTAALKSGTVHTLCGLFWTVLVLFALVGCGDDFSRVSSQGGGAGSGGSGTSEAPSSQAAGSGGSGTSEAPSSQAAGSGGSGTSEAPSSQAAGSGGAGATREALSSGTGTGTIAAASWPACLASHSCGVCRAIDINASDAACYVFVSCLLSHQCGPLDSCADAAGPCSYLAAKGLDCQCER